MYGGIVLKPLPGSATATSWLVRMAATHWLALGCLAAGLVGLTVKRLGVPTLLIPTVLYCTGFALVNARVTHMKPLYAADLIPPLSALAAASVVTLGSIVPALVAVTALGVSVQMLVSARARERPPTWRPEMDALSRTLRDARVLVTPRPAGAMVAYYARCEVVLDSANAADVAALRAAAARGEIDIVVQWGPRSEPGGLARELAGSSAHESFTIEQTRVQLTRLTPRPAPEAPVPARD